MNGHAFGGGLELALACDLRVCAAGAKLGMPPARLGVVYSRTGPASASVDAIGGARTRELFLTAQPVTRADGAALGPRERGSATTWPRAAVELAAADRRRSRRSRCAATSACCALDRRR